MRASRSPESHVWKATMQPVDQSMRFVELVTQARDPPPGNQRGVTLHAPRAAFGRLHFLGDLVDVSMQ